jgi:hypothetical protein
MDGFSGASRFAVFTLLSGSHPAGGRLFVFLFFRSIFASAVALVYALTARFHSGAGRGAL